MKAIDLRWGADVPFVSSFDISPDGQKIVTGHETPLIIIWELGQREFMWMGNLSFWGKVNKQGENDENFIYFDAFVLLDFFLLFGGKIWR